MAIVKWLLAIVTGGFLVAFGVMKFTTAHIFQFIEAKATLEGLPLADLFHPEVNAVVGGAEIAAGALILLGVLLSLDNIRRLGALLAVALIGGAVGFHLSPYLGINTPTGLSVNAAAPWEIPADFTPAIPAEYPPVLFYIAVVMGGVAVVNLLVTLATPKR